MPDPCHGHQIGWIGKTNLTEAERDAISECTSRGQPFGAEKWKVQATKLSDVESSLHPRGRPHNP